MKVRIMHALNMHSYCTNTFPKSQINLVGRVLQTIENIFDKKTQFLKNIDICTGK